MFRTHDADMLGLPGMFGEGQYQWHQVSKVLRNHWYHVTVQAKYEDRISEAVLMIDSEPRLQQLLISQDAETIHRGASSHTCPHEWHGSLAHGETDQSDAW